MIGHLIWYDIDKDIGNNLQNEWRLWIMNLEFWILDGIQTLRTPAGDVLMPFITSFGNGGVIWIVLTVILLLIPKTRKTGLILGAALILDGILCNLLLKNLVRRIPCDIKDAVRLFDSVSVGLFLSFGTYCSVLCRCIGALFCRGKVLVEGSTGFWQPSSHFPECICMYIIQRIFWVERFWESCADISDVGSQKTEQYKKEDIRLSAINFGVGSMQMLRQ